MDNQSDDLNAILIRLFELALDLGHYQKAALEAVVPPPGEDGDDGFDVARAGLVGIARRLLRETDIRKECFADCVSHDAVWPMLLDVYVQTVEQKKVTVSDACIASRAPNTTALRWIGELVERGTLVRTPDPKDRRRYYITLSDDTFVKMSRYLARTAGIASVASPLPVPAGKVAGERANRASRRGSRR